MINISLIGIGFSSWVTSTIYIHNDADIDMAIGKIDTLNIFSNVSLEVPEFSVGSDGLVLDETLVDQVEIRSYFTINNQSVSSLSSNNTFNCYLDFQCSQSSVFTYIESTPTLSLGSAISSQYDGNRTLTTSCSFPISEKTGTTSVIVTYVIKNDADRKISELQSKAVTFTFTVRYQ